ncbi:MULTISPECIES: tetratricopeptide repeat-containing sulfotransferase family protein [Kordiimonas]|jgi:tetratricopeptide (TPR) repeat protein|uniref:tetratricopeptide repeat-containing sulfotransferase family protein n=1 Tax=Kordiimonas TaxID=288021 RepID=UPI00258114DA|nr:tetratricopeptide repeat-containing sulfotransferase family protein [Kordiimonas sp. UBA4487]
MQDNSQIEALKQAQKLIYDGRFTDALTKLSAVLEAAPGHIDALYMRAVCERYAGQMDAALTTLSTLKQASPEFGRALQEEGHLYRTLGRNDEALAAYQLACRANPALVASWQAQAELLAAAGRQQDAHQAAAQAARLSALPKELQAVTNFIYEDKLLKAEKLCRAFLRRNPKHAEGMRLLADIGIRFGALEEAEFLLESALTFEPANVQVRLDYIATLRKRQKFDQALKEAKALHDSDPENPIFLSHYAIESLQAGDYGTALETFDRILEKLPNDATTLTSKGHALKTIGQQDEAVAAYRAAFKAQPAHADAYYGLANLKTYRFEDAEIKAMEQQASTGTLPLDGRIQLHFALGKAYEDREEYDRSFGHYEEGNALKRHQCRYKADQMEEELQTQAAVCTAELFEHHSGSGCQAPDPIFIVGLPRAGSTLLEQILASHSQVDGTMELPNILSLAHKLRAQKSVQAEDGYPKSLWHMSADELRAFGEKYIEDTRIHRGDAPFFIDKMPNNFRHIGLIQLILPNAKIIDARRDPMACCFSGFKQLFAEGQEFTYGLTEIGRYYRDYVALMDHWDSVLPGKVLRVQYEDVVADLETQVRRILDHCGLPFEDACLEFFKTDRSVRTASSEQVRQPINTKGLEPWRPFDAHLAPLRDALGPLVGQQA